MTNALVRVAVPVPLADAFDYRWPGPAPAPAPGCRVRVPFGAGRQIGIVVAHPEHVDLAPGRIKSVLEALDAEPVLDTELLALLRWAAEYYHHPIGEVLTQALPVLLRRGRPAAAPREPVWGLTDAGRAQDTDALARRGARQAQALTLLRARGALREGELRDAGVRREVLSRLAARGWIRDTGGMPAEPVIGPGAPPPPMTREQQRCVAAVVDDGEGYHTYLLQGVTGSGKTEVYMRIIARQLDAGRQSLLLVPEIGLTPQLVGRLEARFGAGLAVMHSGLAEGERLRAWQRARSGKARLIVGTRSAVFAPLARPGLIVVDEEHDTSYKQQDGFKYSARDLAVLRARRLNVPVILASATPSLESVHNAACGRYRTLRMRQRFGAAGEPSIRIIDMNRHANRHGLSTPLVAAIEQRLAADEQVLLFLNRRGFAPALLCTQCGTVEECDRCDARLTLHPGQGHLRCHHCGRTRPLKWACEACGSERVAVGAGTQRITDQLRTLFPETRIERLDRDATARKGGVQAVLADVEHGETRILVGTQMLTKGHDFPRVTLVGVLSADQGLFGTDFRSSERLAQILLQVAGRAGRRDQPGEVLIQTHFPQHPLLSRLAAQDYDEFARLALAEREAAAWPPFAHLILWRAEAASRPPAYAFLERLADAARGIASEVNVLGPAPPAMERRGGRFRAQLLFQGTRRAALHALVESLLPQVRSWPESRRVRWSVDVDPGEV